MAVHQQRLDRRVALAGHRVQPVAIEFRRQGFDAEDGEQRVPFDIRSGVPEQGTKTARVTKTQSSFGKIKHIYN